MATTFDPSAVLGQVTASFMRLPLSQKIIFPLLIIGSVWGLIFVSKWATRPDYVVLYSDLAPADSGAVVERLKAQKIKYEVRGDGTTIAITPPELIHELRLSLASEGLPKDGRIGYELFDQTNLGVTGFVERLKLVRALQGELERTISSLEAVAVARVHITMPEKTVFAKKSNRATASVMIRLRPGGELDKKQIKGIAHLVSGSVEGLDVADVNIVDVYGNLLTAQEDPTGDNLSADATQLQYQHEIEQNYVRRIESMLAKVLGAEKVVARVTAEIDFSKSQREEESFDPAGQVTRSEKSIDEGVGASQRGGIPGVVSNLTEDPSLLSPPSSTKDGANRRETVKNYEVSRAVTRIDDARGKLVRLSVAVLVDGKYVDIVPASAPAATDPAVAPAKSYQALDAEMLRQIEDIVKSAVGFDPARGDTLTVENIPFHVPDESFAVELEKKAGQDMIFNIIAKLGPVLFIVLFFLIMVRPLIKFMVTPTEAEVDLTRLLPTGVEELEKELATERVQAKVPSVEPVVDLAQLETLMAENSSLVKQNPQQAALLIRYWLNDGRL